MSATDAATLTASTKRPPAVSGGKVGEPVPHLGSVAVVPFLPITPEIANSVRLFSPRTARVTYAFADEGNVLPDIEEGDTLEAENQTYIIRSVAEYNRDRAGAFLEIVFEQQEVS